ncbi:SPO12-like protein [Colletotrichum tofieldiae]|uniref:SPO12-like protein n=1 Tax=Colletotrichum tofieldiae TaxID=708197 RepID=A0A161YFF2_9PEZI|nr:SPO12-like protein [Colletotrichum tofieldiae]GKT84884.1 SPO12-like protein [Colletotrichum tofieldiae]
MSPNVLADKDVNAAVVVNDSQAAKDVKSMEYHRQVLQNKMAQEKYDYKPQTRNARSKALNFDVLNRSKTYISPSDNIMSPCTAKLSALRNKQVGKVKPKSLFAQTSAKKLGGGDALFGDRTTTTPTKDSNSF